MTKFTKGLILGAFIGVISMLTCICVFGWWYNKQHAKIEEIVVDSIPSDTPVNLGRIQSFLGKSMIMNDSVYEQIAVIAEQDKMLSYGDSILQIGDVKWRINVMPNGIALMTSIQPDNPKMKQVVKYLNDIYGRPYDYEEDGFNIKWASTDDLVHLRRVHSEEGGTFLFFYW